MFHPHVHLALCFIRLQAGHAFDSAPNLQPPRSSWESKYRKICGHGLACLREEITQDQTVDWIFRGGIPTSIASTPQTFEDSVTELGDRRDIGRLFWYEISTFPQVCYAIVVKRLM